MITRSTFNSTKDKNSIKAPLIKKAKSTTKKSVKSSTKTTLNTTTFNGSITLKNKSQGIEMLASPLFNKGTAFTMQERQSLGLVGLLPPTVTTMEEQAKHTYEQFLQQPSDFAKNIFLTALHDRNEILFFKLLSEHFNEMLPVVFDPTVGQAIKNFSHAFRRPRGLYLSIDHPELIEASFKNLGLGANDIDLIVATDAEEVLGIGDWGVGGIDIAVSKLAIYTAAAGINPKRTIPVMLDVGTNNQTLLNDPFYLGNRHARIRGERFEAFVDAYVKTVTKLFPNALLHWEDFGPNNARRILEKYRDNFATFNDDTQGTGVITLAALFSALSVTNKSLKDQKVVIFGAGTAGIGIADQICDAMVQKGLSRQQALKQIWCVDKNGLLTDEIGNSLQDFQLPFARRTNELTNWKHSGTNQEITLADVVHHVQPTVLIGASTKPGAFTQAIVKEMAAHCKRPIILPLSNPAELAEAKPSDLLAWTEGRALIATGGAFNPVTFKRVTFVIGQANNALIFPGLALGTIVSRAKKVSNKMFIAAANAVAGMVDPRQAGASLLPQIEDLRTVSTTVAIAVARAAAEEKLARVKLDNVATQVRKAMWQPEYTAISRTRTFGNGKTLQHSGKTSKTKH